MGVGLSPMPVRRSQHQRMEYSLRNGHSAGRRCDRVRAVDAQRQRRSREDQAERGRTGGHEESVEVSCEYNDPTCPCNSEESLAPSQPSKLPPKIAVIMCLPPNFKERLKKPRHLDQRGSRQKESNRVRVTGTHAHFEVMGA